MCAMPAPQLPSYEFLDKQQVAAVLHQSVRQIERWTSQGRLGHVRLGLKTLYTPEQVAAFVASCTVPPADQPEASDV